MNVVPLDRVHHPRSPVALAIVVATLSLQCSASAGGQSTTNGATASPSTAGASTESTSSASVSPAPSDDASNDADATSFAPRASSGAPASVASPPHTTRTRDPEEEYPPVDEAPQNVAVVARHPDPTRADPMHGHFTLAEATAGLPVGSDLVADIETPIGTFTCSLMQAQAPLTVANFVGLARGVRDFWDPVAGRWTRRPYFDSSVFHRVIPGFMVQGGDILRSGRGGPGYTIADENVANHDTAGLLCMANHGPNTGGGQFFITEVPLPRLNGSYSVFGRCTPTELVARIARVRRSRHNQPIEPVTIQRVTVHR